MVWSKIISKIYTRYYTGVENSFYDETGVDFKKEKKLSELKNALIEGVYDSSGSCLYLGNSLAQKLKVGLNDEIYPKTQHLTYLKFQLIVPLK